MTIIRLKRGHSQPSGLLEGEPAVNLSERRLYIGGMWEEGYPLGCQSIAWPKRNATPKIVGDLAGTALGTLALVASRLYFVPFVIPRPISLSSVRISVTTAAAGLASIGVYQNTVIGVSDAPGNLIFGASNAFDTGTTGDKDSAYGTYLEAGRLYWWCLICSGAPTLRAVPVASVQTALGRQVNGNPVISHLFAAGSGSSLPNPAPTNLSAGTGSIPAIYLVGS